MTKVFFRVKRNGRWADVEIEHLTDAERGEALGNFDRAALLRTVHCLCAALVHAEAEAEIELHNIPGDGAPP